MEVILLKDVKSLGRKGDVVKVAEGYARNYLFAHGLAVEASGGNVRNLEHERAVVAKKISQEEAAAKHLAERLAGLRVTVKARAGDGGKLFGSVTNKDIAVAIGQALAVSFDKRKVELAEPIKLTGTYTVPVRLYHELVVDVQVDVVEA